MPRQKSGRKSARKRAKNTRRQGSRKRQRGLRIPRPWAGRRTRRWLLEFFQRMPVETQLVVAGVVAIALAVMLNWAYQVIRKPSELFFPVSGTLYKVPAETWETYAPLFRRHATPTITPDFLAALAQVEGSGNPIVRTYWRWSFSHRPFEIYRPASSAVGMYQITDGTFEEAKRLCIHEHTVVEDGPWNDPKSCWFNSLYTRTIPSHAVELTSAYLDRHVHQALRRHRIRNASMQHKQALATVIHLCGAGAGRRFAARGLRLTSAQRCGDHSVAHYVAKVRAMQSVFRRLADQD